MTADKHLDVNYKWFGLLLLTGFTLAPALLFLFIAHMSRLDNDVFYESQAVFKQQGHLHEARIVDRALDDPYVVFTLDLDGQREVTHRVWGEDARQARSSDTLTVWELDGEFFAEIERPTHNDKFIKALYWIGFALLAVGLPFAALFARESWTRGPGKDMCVGNRW